MLSTQHLLCLAIGPINLRQVGDMWYTPGHGIEVLSAPKYPFLDCLNTSERELCFIPKADLFLGHPVYKLTYNDL